jgi:hypothetical protein
MKTYQILVSQNFAEYVEVQAESAEQAYDLIMEQIESGAIDPVRWYGDIYLNDAEEITE